MVRTWLFFSWWQDLNRRSALWPRPQRWGILAASVFVAVIGRLWAQTAPWNYDFTAFVAVSDQVLAGGNPYATGKHNYGPIWFLIHSSIRRIAHDPIAFRLSLAILLTLVDVAIALMLTKRGYLIAACLFLMAPITIAITGQHGQFDNIAVALALAAAMLASTARVGNRIGWVDVGAVLLLGLSLSTKHDFLLLPLWLAFMQGSWMRRAFYFLTPLALFGLSLLPYWLLDPSPIRQYVLNYRSGPNAPFYYALFPDELVWGWINRGYIVFIFLGILAALGWWYRRMPMFEATLIYGICLVVFSSAIVDQYFAIPMSGVSVFLNLGFLVWIVYVSIYLLGEPEDLNLPIFNSLKLHLAPYQEATYKDQFVYLFIGWLLMNFWLWREGVLRAGAVDVRASRGECRTTQPLGGSDLPAEQRG
jgi:hypothetical protein